MVAIILMEKPAAEIAGKIYNAGYRNHSVEDLGKMVVEVIGQDVAIEWEQTNDNRSYHVSSQKIRDELGFVPKHTIKDAVKDLKEAFENNLLEDPTGNEMYVNIKRMQSINIE